MKPIRCPCPSCSWSGPNADLVAHLSLSHNEVITCHAEEHNSSGNPRWRFVLCTRGSANEQWRWALLLRSSGNPEQLFVYYADLSGFIDKEYGNCTMTMLRASGSMEGPKFTSQVELKSSDGRHRVALQSPVEEVKAWDPNLHKPQTDISSTMLESLWEQGRNETKKLRVCVTLMPEAPPLQEHNTIETLQALEESEPDFRTVVN